MTPPWSLRRLHALDDAQIAALAGVLIDCVEGGASVSFMLPLTRDRAVAFWRRVAQGVAAGERALLVAEDAQGAESLSWLSLPSPRVHFTGVAGTVICMSADRTVPVQ